MAEPWGTLSRFSNTFYNYGRMKSETIFYTTIVPHLGYVEAIITFSMLFCGGLCANIL